MFPEQQRIVPFQRASRFRPTLLMAIAIILAWASPAHAHMPYIERQDFSAASPFIVRHVEQSIAVYAWLETPTDVDHYQIEIVRPSRLFAQVLVPACPAYADFSPAFAVIGPGLPPPGEALPMDLPAGHGAVVVADGGLHDPRQRFYEPFGGKWYYQGPTFDQIVSEPGPWQVIYWDPNGQGGDYVAALGTVERFPVLEILRVIRNTLIVRRNGELHTDC